MKIDYVKSDGRVYHLTPKNVTRPVLGPTRMAHGIAKRFRGRIELRDADGIVTWKNVHSESGLQGFRVVRVKYHSGTEVAEVISA